MDTSQISIPLHEIESLIQKCKVYCMEVDVNNSTMSFQQPIDPSFYFVKDTKINILNSLDQDYRNKLFEIVKSFKMGPGLEIRRKLYLFKPQTLTFLLILEKQLSASDNISNLNFQPDTYFEKYAKTAQLDIDTLESRQSQLEWVFQPDLSFDEGMIQLRSAIDQYDVKTEDLWLSYANQNLHGFSSSAQGEWMAQRNVNMARKLERLISTNSTFITVGIAHLVGENGLLNLLSLKGFIIEPVRIDIHLNYKTQ